MEKTIFIKVGETTITENISSDELEHNLSGISRRLMLKFAKNHENNAKKVSEFCGKKIIEHFPHINPRGIGLDLLIAYYYVCQDISAGKWGLPALNEYIGELCESRGIENLFADMTMDKIFCESFEICFWIYTYVYCAKYVDRNLNNNIISAKPTKLSNSHGDCYKIAVEKSKRFDIFCSVITPLILNPKKLTVKIDHDFGQIDDLPRGFCERVDILYLNLSDNLHFRFKQLGKFTGLRSLNIEGGNCGIIDETVLKMEKLESITMPLCDFICPDLFKMKNLNEIRFEISFTDKREDIESRVCMSDIKRVEYSTKYVIFTVKK